MAIVKPIYDYEDVKNIRRVLTKFKNVREAECFFISCHIGLRASDLLNLKFEDFKKKRLYVTEIKTGKDKDFPISDIVRECVAVLKKWYKEKFPHLEPVYLFQTTGNRGGGAIKPITQPYLYRKINEACEAIGLEDNFGTHTGRKTFGYHLYQQTGDIVNLQKMFNHKYQAVTLEYIGSDSKKRDEMYMNLDFSK